MSVYGSTEYFTRPDLVHQKISMFLRLWASSRAIPPSPNRAMHFDLYHTQVQSIVSLSPFQKQSTLPKMIFLYTLRDIKLAENSKHEQVCSSNLDLKIDAIFKKSLGNLGQKSLKTFLKLIEPGPAVAVIGQLLKRYLLRS